MLSPKLKMFDALNPYIAQEARKVAPLTIRQLRFILNWHDLMGEEGREFGFRDGQGLDEQTKLAVEFYLKTEKEWQSQVLAGEAVSPLLSYIYNHGIKDGVDFPDDFCVRMKELEKGGEYES